MGRAQTSHALRWPASETVIGVVRWSANDTVASETPDGKFTGARSGVPASAFGKCARVRFAPASTCHLTTRSSRPRVVASAMCFALRLHMSAAPTQGGLTQALGGRKAFDCFTFQHGDFTGFGWRCSSACFTRRCFFGQVRPARSHITCVTLAGFGNGDWLWQLAVTDTAASVTSG